LNKKVVIPAIAALIAIFIGLEAFDPSPAIEQQQATIKTHSPTNTSSLSAAAIIDELREGNPSSFGIRNDTSYVFSPDKSEISTPNNNTHTRDFGIGMDIAVVSPSFTAAAYNDHIFIPFTVNMEMFHMQLISQVTLACSMHQFPEVLEGQPLQCLNWSGI
jgi:hypothetical protein